ncbi:trypsin 3A1 [Scaptodrosophila lebanonensis]|uniref:Trypsin 3A1 n=1 Tax=Drosophila lebanonensis TaxID=7225 RepID=A0A6J2U6N5_DROLE|nr:trypsin 3A1 [Scaptodrosophila lebanonensis]
MLKTILLYFTILVYAEKSCILGQGQHPKPRIVGGFPAIEGSIPYMASLQQYGQHFCGGAVVNERTIVTAAHCLEKTTPRMLKIKVGGTNRAADYGQLFTVAAFHYNEKWTRQTMDWDIGIVRLDSPMAFSDKVRAIPLAGSSVPAGTFATIAGWGYTTIFGPGTELLRYARVPIVDQELCNRLMGNIITDRMVCAGYMRGSIDACQMDSGGPLVVREELYGIVSWGVGCALPNKPGVYTRIQIVRTWLNDIMSRFYNEVL